MPQLALAPGPIERIRADVAVVPLFAGERPLRAAAGRVDWRLCGRLSTGRDLWHYTLGTMVAVHSRVDLSAAVDHSARSTVVSTSAIIRF